MKQPSITAHRPAGRKSHIRAGHRVFIAFLSMVAILYTSLIVRRLIGPSGAKDGSLYDLVATGNVAHDAREYLRAAQGSTVSKPLAELLTDRSFVPAATHEHPLLGQAAPDFTLNDDRGRSHRLSQLLETGPVVVVFYYGYHCSHCVAQLFGIEKDLDQFRELNVQVVTLSADPTRITAARFEQYGRFGFPVLSDEQNGVAEQYGVYRRAQGDRDEDLQHGTFLIGQDGKVLWAYAGAQPFVDNKSLLFILSANSELN